MMIDDSEEYGIDELLVGLSGALLILSGRVQIAAVTKSLFTAMTIVRSLC